ncbi:MAG: box helicase [Sphingomonas bacterium]|nr:TRCF domain-containing protein [Sphingomonas bacterium]MDB5690546.1 box helicase [Sphingomonas bacterium]
MVRTLTTVVDDDGAGAGAAPPVAVQGAIGPTAMRIAAADRDTFVIAADEPRATAIAAALRAMLPDAAVLCLPESDDLPGDPAPASAGVAGQRVAVLRRLRARAAGRTILVTTAESVARKVAPPEAFDFPPRTFAVGTPVDGEALAAELMPIGYFLDDRIDEPGEIAVRGGVIDIFPADRDTPVRIEIAEGKVAAIAAFDPVSQRTTVPLDSVDIGAAAEPPAGADGCSLFDHFPDAALAIDVGAEARRDSFVDLVNDTRQTRSGSAPAIYPIEAASWEEAVAQRHAVRIERGQETDGVRFVQARQPGRMLFKALREARERGDVVVLAGAPRDLRFMARQLEKGVGEAPGTAASWRDVADAPPGALLALAMEIERGWRSEGLAVIAAADVLGSRAGSGGPGATVDPLTGEATAFQLGDAVIHEDHGLGLLRGIETVETGGEVRDAIRLEYAGGAQRLVPVEEADRLWRYGAGEGAVTLDKLDGSTWQKRRGDIDAALAETARGLTELARERAGRTAPAMTAPASDYEKFAAGFPFTLTPDQHRAIEAARDDLATTTPMDRLVVGDVGYGKTEVALRAAAIAVLAGHQVAVAAPTTVLVRQHVESFRRRFERIGKRVEGLSGLSTAAEVKAVRAGLADGSIDVVIGTHAIGGKRVDYARLGLVVIDEEQRFGMAAKAELRTIGDSPHVLTLTATPIPRTLQAALVGLQQISVIATPPARRQPIRTTVGIFDPAAVRAALVRERGRGGQSFVVVSRIEDMAPIAGQLAALVPELVVRQAHGKMPAAEIDEAMVRFATGDGDVLLATNIIEAGLDVPRANTMIVWRADRFGLSQLHQLRGRVGRGRLRGHILLTTDPDVQIAPATLKRLRTLEALDRLGAGFAISARDLDQRGAGDLLGEEQAGHVKLIGVGLYQHLLGDALRTARGETVERWTPELNLGVSGSIPEEWIPEPEVRINLYARLARATDAEELDALAAEMEDRFGQLPDEVQTLFALARIRHLACPARIARIDAGPAAIAITPRRDFAGDVDAAGLKEKNGRLLLAREVSAGEARIQAVSTLLERLDPD